MKFLIIDDSGSLRTLLKKRLLQKWPEAEITGHDPLRDGRPGSAFPWETFDIVFLDYDLGLAQETGIDWLPDMKRSANAPFVIMVTGGGNENVAVRAIRQGANEYLIKYDVVTDKLYEIVAEHLAQRQTGHNPVVTPGVVVPAPGSARWDIPGYANITELARKLSITLLAERLEDGKKVVLKVQNLQGESSPIMLKRFIQELNILSGLDHPHIIKILDHGVTERYFYYAVNYYAQGDLADTISRGGVTSDKARAYILQLARGLSVLHNAGIVHRDIKPSNILIADADTLVIADLGIAKDLSCAEALTSHGQVMGTPFYMSPEQINSKELDYRSDIYSLGILFHELLTGSLPFPGSSIMEVAYKHAYDTPPPLPETLAIYQPILDRMLKKSPEDRYQNLEQFIHDVTNLGSG